jgi:uncharacterized protein (TIGR02001 family)
MKRALTLSAIVLSLALSARAEDKATWTGPFGGALSANLTVTTDYSYRGISQTMRDVALQGAIGYETPTIGASPITAYVGAWGSSVNFPNAGTGPEIDMLAGFRARAFDNKFTADLGYIGYRYLGIDSNLFYNYNEFGLVLGYDFDVVALQAVIRHSPNFFANSGTAWYKWAQATVPLRFFKLPFSNLRDDVAFKAFAAIGSQYVERNTFYGIPRNDYWDWQLGLTMTLFGVDLTVAYTDTNIDSSDCGRTQNCAARAIFSVSKTF